MHAVRVARGWSVQSGAEPLLLAGQLEAANPWQRHIPGWPR